MKVKQMRLTQNFTLNELTKSDYAIRNGIDNTPSQQEIVNLKILCENVLQPIRDHFNKPVIINSGFRNSFLNSAIGGSKSSDHCKGMAADIEISGIRNFDLAVWIRTNLNFRQLILEFYNPNDEYSGWVHVSYNKDDLKNQVLTAVLRNNKTVYMNGLIS